MTSIQGLIPRGCTVETYDLMSTVHDETGDVIFIVCVQDATRSAKLARLIAGVPGLIAAADASLDNGLLMPLAHGMEALDLAVNPPQQLPSTVAGLYPAVAIRRDSRARPPTSPARGTSARAGGFYFASGRNTPTRPARAMPTLTIASC
jgi:hypothetical protein